MNRKPEPTSPSKLIAALIFLAASGWIALSGLTSLQRPTPQPPAGQSVPDEIDDEPTIVAEKKKLEDLLHRYGSFAAGTSVRDRFTRAASADRKPTTPLVDVKPVTTEPKTDPVVKPTVETDPKQADPGNKETEDKVPEHDVSLVLLTKLSSRAIVDGRLVGIGDQIAAGQIVEIQAEGVLVQRGKKRILFRLRPR